ncbi:unnamed protein product [Cladocopium goreaui]|uniref:Acetyl-coenzyme A transporter 1 n=1 Tax=Cladocopium goreaui TaxID=2562237 RepID=A0A9P1C2A3_9DINO|nr:unnamed protein product [Cladocopium goreaui]
MWHTKPPAWEVCWDFADRQKQETWQDGYNAYGYEATTEVLPPWQPWANNYDWTMQTPYVGPGQSWQYLQQSRLEMQARLQMQAATGSTMQPQGPDSLALPPSLERRLQERQSQAPKASKAKAVEAAVPAVPPPGKDFSGSIKSLSDRHGYGFIACDEVHRMYGRDTYLPQEMIPEGTKVQDSVVFRIGLSKKGHPQVIQVKHIVPC